MPDRPRLVVVNTTPINALSLIGQLDLLHKLSDHKGGVRLGDDVVTEILRLAGEL